MNDCGVYAIINAVNGQAYIGSSKSLTRRWREHRTNLRRGRHGSRRLQQAWQELGEDVFSIVLIEETTHDADERVAAEQVWLDRFNRAGLLYNARLEALCVRPRRTPYIVTPEHRAKISAAFLGCKLSAAHKEKIRLAMLGRRLSPESTAKSAATRRGTIWSTAQRARASGRPNTPETRAKIAQALRGKSRPQDVRAKISATLKRKHQEGHKIGRPRRDGR